MLPLPPNLLPEDGQVYHWGPVLPTETARNYYHQLSEEIDWQRDEGVIFGKKFQTERRIGWYGDEPFLYRYSNANKYASQWTPGLKELKAMIEDWTGHSFNSCLINLYPSGREGVGWHSDGEPMLGPQPTIASLSLGASRRFVLRHKQSKEKVEVSLENGALLMMAGDSQRCWHHSLPKMMRVAEPRISLTFRTIFK